MKFNKIKDPFVLESIRAKLANDSNLIDLKETYTSDLPAIKDYNTSSLWDSLNKSHKTDKFVNPMEWDKLQNVVRMIRNESGNCSNVLNVGFGSGNLVTLIHMNKFSVSWFGIDISNESFKSAQKKFPEYMFSVGNVSNLPYKNSYFDIVVALELFEHIIPTLILNCLNEVRRVLKRNGLLILTVPLNEGLEKMIKRGINPNAHVRIYTPELIKAELKLMGFEIDESYLYYAFKNNYIIKKFILKMFPVIRNPNGILLKARKK